jgi:hypothetical protein
MIHVRSSMQSVNMKAKFVAKADVAKQSPGVCCNWKALECILVRGSSWSSAVD